MFPPTPTLMRRCTYGTWITENKPERAKKSPLHAHTNGHKNTTIHERTGIEIPSDSRPLLNSPTPVVRNASNGIFVLSRVSHLPRLSNHDSREEERICGRRRLSPSRGEERAVSRVVSSLASSAVATYKKTSTSPQRPNRLPGCASQLLSPEANRELNQS